MSTESIISDGGTTIIGDGGGGCVEQMPGG